MNKTIGRTEDGISAVMGCVGKTSEKAGVRGASGQEIKRALWPHGHFLRPTVWQPGAGLGCHHDRSRQGERTAPGGEEQLAERGSGEGKSVSLDLLVYFSEAKSTVFILNGRKRCILKY